jgi:hypothetical protein
MKATVGAQTAQWLKLGALRLRSGASSGSHFICEAAFHPLATASASMVLPAWAYGIGTPSSYHVSITS